MLKTKDVTIPKDPAWGRDQGKQFRITEMPAEQAEKWGMRAFLAFKGTEAQIPTEVRNLGMVGVAILGLNAVLRATVKFEDLEPLLDEMFTCVQAVPEVSNPNFARALLPGEVQEVSTRAWLRSQVLELHTGFSLADGLFKLLSEITQTVNSLST